MAERVPVAVLLSGRGSNMVALADAAADPACPYRIALVTGDVPDAPGLDRAADMGLPVARLPKPMAGDKAGFYALLDATIREAGAEVIALAGFMRILPGDFVARWDGKILNIHPSLLPKYKGLDTHARAIEAGDKVAGCSVHVVTEELDGGKVLGRAVVPILAGDTVDRLAARVLAAEHRLYPRLLAVYVAR